MVIASKIEIFSFDDADGVPSIGKDREGVAENLNFSAAQNIVQLWPNFMDSLLFL